MNAQLETINRIGKKPSLSNQFESQFASRVFGRKQIEQLLAKHVAQNWLNAIDGKEKLDLTHTDVIADVLKDWALKQGATHYTHWFQPLHSTGAEKHESFLQVDVLGNFVTSFRGKDLLRGEPDASSFPHGGLRTTHQARGYTVWDPTAFPFLWEAGDGLTLCIPSLFFSWKGEALDHKIPLLRSEEKLNQVVLKLLHLCKVSATRVYSTLGVEQEYFVIDRDLFLLRSDLLLSGRTVFGEKPAKGQELEDHYLSSVKDRVLAYMREFEEAALRLGIPVKTRHNEVAPAQHEVAPIFERASHAIDHNVQLMELMRQIALKHELACLLHEKPFAGINGSGKHSNWSLATDTGMNLLDPNENSLVFVTLLAAILRAIHEHAALLRASIASAGNDHRLGGSEAPPTILSIYLGETLQNFVMGLKNEGHSRTVDLGLSVLPRYEIDSSDRNRTASFAFTGNKFEFRAVGASAHPALPISIIHSIVADSLQLILDEINDAIGDRKLQGQDLFDAALPVLRKHFKAAEPILFDGNNYSIEWEKEAERRGLPNIRSSFHAFRQFLEKKNRQVFEGILSEKELDCRYDIFVEQYVKTLHIEINLMIELFQTQILPAAQKDCMSRGIQEPLIDEAIYACTEIKKIQKQATGLGWEAKGKVFSELMIPKMAEFRKKVDALEMVVDHAVWPLPKYRELLFLI